MTWPQKARRWVARQVGITLSDLDRIMDAHIMGGPTHAGIAVNEWIAQEFSVNAAIVNAISQDMAKLPLHLMRRDGASREQADDHPLSALLREQPNPIMTAFAFRQTQWAHLLHWGNSYAWIKRDGIQRPRELRLLEPHRMEVSLTGQFGSEKRAYLYNTKQGNRIALRQRDVFHLYGLGFDGCYGYSPVQVALRQALGLALAVEKYGGEYFDSPIPLTVLKHPSHFKDQAAKTAFWEAWNKGIKEKKRFGLLENGLEIDNFVSRMPNEAAQFLQTRRYQKEEFCMWYRMPRHKMADVEQRAQTSVEQNNLEYVVDCLSSHAVNYEQAAALALLDENERQTLFFKHNFRMLLRGDVRSQGEYLDRLVKGGMVTPNEARAWLDLNPQEGADDLYMQINMAPLRLIPEVLTAKIQPPQAREGEEPTVRDVVLATLIGGGQNGNH